MGFGSGVGAFAQGFTQGLSQSDAIAKQWREQQIKREIAKVMGNQGVDRGVEDEALWRSDLSPEQRAMLEQQTGKLGLSRVGNRDFGTPTEAQAFAEQYNSPEQQMSRVADVYGKYGDVERALGLRRDVQNMAFQRQQMDLAKAADARAAEQSRMQADIFKHTQDEWKAKEALKAGLQRASADAASEQASYEAGMRDLSRMTPAEYKALRSGKADTLWMSEMAGLKRGKGDELRARAQVYAQLGGPENEANAALMRKDADAADAEGLQEALKRMNAGDLAGANVMWNARGEFNGQLATRTYIDKKTGKKMVDLFDIRTGQSESLPMDELELTAKERMQQALKERELAMMERYRQAMAANSGAGSKSAGYGVIGSVDGKPVYQQAGKMGFWMKDDKGNVVEYLGPMDKIKGLAADKPQRPQYSASDVKALVEAGVVTAEEGKKLMGMPGKYDGLDGVFGAPQAATPPAQPKPEKVTGVQDRELRRELAGIKQQLDKLGDVGPTSYQLKKRAAEINALLGR